MKATMMNFPLTLNHLIERAGTLFGDVEVVSQMADKSLRRDTYADIYRRTKALAQGLKREGLEQGDRVATLMWNHYAHLEVYFGAPMAGGVYHTLNLRLAPKDLAYIINHADDRFLIVDDVLVPLLQKVQDEIDIEKIFVVRLTDQELPEGFHDYEELIEGADESWTPDEVDEDDAVGLCYTSGTTGKPKGVLYSHRSLVLHSFASALPDMLGVSQRDVMVPVVPMFHANAWGLPFTCAMIGCKQVMPGPHLKPDALLDLYEKENVTSTAGVPTIWMGILQLLDAHPDKWDLQNMSMVVGGAAAPESMIRRFDEYGHQVIHAWGMTELTPLGTVSRVKGSLDDADEDTKYALRAKQGVAAPFVELRAVGEDGPVAHDGESMGELQCRGPWVASDYFNNDSLDDKWTDDGWFRTGDVVTLDEHGYMEITDRTKDLIKSGGEWISSVALENALMGHQDIAEAAVVAIKDETYSERPLAAIVLKDGASVDDEALNDFLLGEGFAKWMLPDVYARRDEIPRGATGKFLKTALRDEYWGYKEEHGEG